MQFEADMVGAPVERTSVAELSAVGVAHLAGLTAGLFTLDGLAKMDRDGDRFTPGAASSTTRRRGEARPGDGPSLGRAANPWLRPIQDWRPPKAGSWD